LTIVNSTIKDSMVHEAPIHLSPQAETQPKAEWHAATERACEDAYAGGADVSVILIDLDKFKSVNDTLGHGVGDRVIDDFGNRLLPSVMRRRNEDSAEGRALDVIGHSRREDNLNSSTETDTNISPGHVGGDEFALLVRGPIEAAEAIAERVRTVFDTYLEEPQNAGLKALEVGVSYGIATLDTANQMTKSDMLVVADRALYHDKLSRLRRLSPEQIEIFLRATAMMVEGAGIRLRDVTKYMELYGQESDTSSEL
jgi:GGDEF domain-containing protein